MGRGSIVFRDISCVDKLPTSLMGPELLALQMGLSSSGCLSGEQGMVTGRMDVWGVHLTVPSYLSGLSWKSSARRGSPESLRQVLAISIAPHLSPYFTICPPALDYMLPEDRAMTVSLITVSLASSPVSGSL